MEKNKIKFTQIVKDVLQDKYCWMYNDKLKGTTNKGDRKIKICMIRSNGCTIENDLDKLVKEFKKYNWIVLQDMYYLRDAYLNKSELVIYLKDDEKSLINIEKPKFNY